MTRKQKLELTWVGKDNRPRLEPRILIEDSATSYHAAARVSDADIFDNVLIHGDNLLALKALEADYAGKVKCVFIDPPYNTGSAFTHYDDGLEHSIWLGLMRDRLEIIHRLLSDDGSLWITIDDNEAHYLKVMCDEVFGRVNFFGDIIWQHSVQGKNDAKTISLHHNHLLVYSKSPSFVRNTLPRSDKHNVNYGNADNDPRGLWRAGDVRSPNLRENLKFDVFTPSGKRIPPPEKGWRWAKETFDAKVASGEITFVNNETKVLRKIYLADQKGRVPESIWFAEEAGTTREATGELRNVLSEVENLFPTPKPERLLERVIYIATNPGDLVLDSFAGSGTTGAVAHKMGRRWIMVELNEQAHTHIAPRLQKVIDGSDQGGISKAVEWKGGGGFRYYELAPSLLEKDKWGREVISPEYDAAMLARAICKLEGFTYAPSDSVYWQQGHSSETDFLYVTTQTLGPEELAALSEEVGDSRSLLILCAAFRGNADLWPNLTLRKIPNHIRSKCEWGHDDYSLNVANLPMAEPEPASPPSGQAGLFDGEDDL
jgi:adenine-specific DNA-methyltransferase